MINKISNINFNGKTRIYAISDTHQETRKAANFLSKILDTTKNDKNTLLLHCGDFFRGLYPKELEKDCYIKMKEANPDIEMVVTLGNNDFGFNKQSFEFLLETIKSFVSKGIRVVSANIFDKSGKYLEGVSPYTIVERGGDRSLITGFCINNLSSTVKDNAISVDQINVMENLKKVIEKEKPDNVIILNHDFMPSSQKIIEYCENNEINIDLIIGGHDHRIVPPDEKKNIYYPESHAASMYYFDLENNKNIKVFKDIKKIEHDNLDLNPIFKNSIEEFETQEGLFNVVAKRVLNLVHTYSEPCTYGTFFADSMKNAANSDIAFVSTGFIQKSLIYRENGVITNYELKQSMPTETPVQIVELTTNDLKEVFSHSFKAFCFSEGNRRFLQCSSNLKIEGNANEEKQIFEITQITINDEKLLDSFGSPLSVDKKYKCAIDSFIAKGGQDFKMLENKEKEILYINGKESKINEVLKQAIKEIPVKYKEGDEYPCFKIEVN